MNQGSRPYWEEHLETGSLGRPEVPPETVRRERVRDEAVRETYREQVKRETVREIIRDEELPERLLPTIQDLLQSPAKMRLMKEAALKIAKPTAAQCIAEEIERLAKSKGAHLG